MIKPVHPFRFARIERLRELLERDYRMAVDPNTGVSTTKLVRPDPQLLDAGLVLDRDPEGCELGPWLRACERYGTQPVDTPE
ncbi:MULTISPECIES: hypothetical protein [unclassified Bradyrhizobium]|uniref:hypothetical protein n=1 Tax=unclassified Bradyrhizobium TaxID=2631580 RepID=UPI001FFB8593|nr:MULTISPECIES: hypothetical protein [unclassified Bradyrhizobium]MCK1379720.1 hypothetical protein [Bradyrhizobium sp. 24]MCK1267653.1 hypothetical protein [Bradyrhizobium sp. 84]MCK1290520.1 hypothetical protein [Bradyrhizobium sp. 30]MCK1296982.1 hypothetical protein [Bradyrhizobium sp. 37]MCK1308735.1 hypothetical protein [Bradyrhizobium sp. 45]